MHAFSRIDVRTKFHALALICLITVYLLVFVGSTVRSTGSGMGCPDWPTCFGRWVPPTSVEQLPANYQATYSAYRHEKNIKFAHYLSVIGAQGIANRLLEDQSILQEADFNVVKTWTEYINRLLGVVVGLLFVALALFSVRFWRSNTKLFLLTWVALLLVIVQGWFGSIVVSTNLTSWTITIHMFLALLIVLLLAFLVGMSTFASAYRVNRTTSRAACWLLVGCALVLLAQIFLGTTVRAAIDSMVKAEVPRTAWIARLGESFQAHRLLSIALLLLHGALLYILRGAGRAQKLPIALVVLTLVTLLSGMGMAYFGVPFLLQPLHLTLAMVLFGLQGYFFHRLIFSLSFVK